MSGIINITVIYGHKTKSTPKVEKKKKHLEEKDDKDVIGGGGTFISINLQTSLFQHELTPH